MTGKALPLGHKDIEALILRALVRKLIVKRVLSPDAVRALLLAAVMDLDDFGGGTLRPEAARRIVEEDLTPAFLAS